MQRIKYGKVSKVEVMNPTRETEKTYRDNELTVTRVRYTIPKQVKNQAEEHEAYLQFSNELAENKGMLDPEWRIEYSQRGRKEGFYYVVKAYTLLEYGEQI